MTIALPMPPAGHWRSFDFDMLRSPEGGLLTELWNKFVVHEQETGRSVVATSALHAAALEASTADWDGYGAASVGPSTFSSAVGFLNALGPSASIPQVAATPDGGISFEWWEAADWGFTVVVRPSGDLTYAGLFGKASTYGTEPFSGHQVPSVIRDGLRRIGAEAPRVAA